MREKIAEIVRGDFFDRMTVSDSLEIADQILAVLKAKIEKVENPHIAESARIGFESCRQKILKTLEGK